MPQSTPYTRVTPGSYVDRLPFHTPATLDDLRGPRTGPVIVPTHICTAPDRLFDLTVPSQRRSLYSAVVRDGTPADQATYLDKDTLVDLWPDLNLPRRCRDTWTARFPELAALPVRALVV